MHNRLPDNCKFIPYDHPEMLPQDTILITQSCPLWRIPFIDKFDRKTKIFFWNLHPDNLNPNLVRVKSGLKGIVRKLINLSSYHRKWKLRNQTEFFINHKSIYFMDMENLEKTEKTLGFNIANQLLLPIINNISTPKQILNYSADENELIKCIWVGRIEGFKLQILLHTISRLESYKKHKVHLTIVGGGDGKNVVDLLLSKCSNLSYSCIENLPFDELKNIFKDKHLAFGMGTSALDSASIGIPTICLDYSHTEIKKYYKFHFLYENTGYIVASEINSTKFLSDKCNLDQIFSEIIHNGEAVSDKCFNYCLENHSYRIADKIPNILSNSSLTIEKLLEKRLFDTDLMTKLIVKLLRRNKIDASGFILF